MLDKQSASLASLVHAYIILMVVNTSLPDQNGDHIFYLRLAVIRHALI